MKIKLKVNSIMELVVAGIIVVAISGVVSRLGKKQCPSV